MCRGQRETSPYQPSEEIRLSLPSHSRADDGCPVAAGYFCAADPLPSQSPTAPHSVERSVWRNQTPNIAQGVGWVGGLTADPSRVQRESCAQPCPHITQTEGQERIHKPSWSTVDVLEGVCLL
ncbi:hypothetical protein OYC64_018734 [Pagothenia borchgrevinki]|uniref:Uncharacterized protein n=1 Tax=Pagothenia borchgrevinki TaxID=8213 RepID=A0ABD2GSG0_PAGBO